MTNRNLETLVDSLGLKTVVAILADICHRKADQVEMQQGLLEGRCTDWRADSRTLRSILTRLKTP